jgi:hypothetical protein
MVGAIERTVVWACVSEHGWADEHAVPEPVGEVWTVVMTAAVAGAVMPAAASSAAAATVVSRPAARGVREEGSPGTLRSYRGTSSSFGA